MNQVVVVVVVGYSLLHWPCEPGVYICVGVFVRYSIGRVNQVCGGGYSLLHWLCEPGVCGGGGGGVSFVLGGEEGGVWTIT